MSKIFIEESTLTAIGDSIRAKTGGSDLIAPLDMPSEIDGIVTGGEFTEEDRTFTNNIDYMFYNGKFLDWQDKVPFILKDIKSAKNAFDNCPKDADLSKITITTPEYTNDSATDVGYMFLNYMGNSLPKIKGKIGFLQSSLFTGCNYLQDEKIRNLLVNDDLILNWKGQSWTTNPGLALVFSGCYSVRNISDILLYIHQTVNPIVYNSALSDYYNMVFYNCRNLDEICNIPIFTPSNMGNNTYDMMNQCFYNCSRAKDITFATDNGVCYQKNWKQQTMDLSNYVGYSSSTSYILNYNSGITADKQVKDDATYQALKNDPDWFTLKLEYSRYNHDSAVNTINSLPDTSAYLATAGGTNTIKFKGNSGSATDGGAINTLTEEEVAVAAAKGWTVTLL